MYIKMAKSKIEKSRLQSLKVLASVKSKLNIRTYNAYMNKIYDKGFAANNKITAELELLKTITTSVPLVKAGVKKVVEKNKIITNTNFIDTHKYGKVIAAIWKYKGKDIIITYVDNGKVIKTFNIKLNDYKKLKEDIFYSLFYPDETAPVNIYPDGKILLSVESANKILPNKLAQAFKQGITNCLFTPMIEWAESKMDNALTKGTQLKYESRINVMKKLELQYREGGVDEKKIQEIADKLQVNIEINQPFQKKFIVCKSNKKALTSFKFVNTKLNHIDLNEVVNKEPIYLDYDELQKLHKEYSDDKDKFFTYTRGKLGYTSISTLTNTYRIKNDYREFIDKFERENKINECYLDDYRDVEVSKYVRNATHFNHTIDFKDLRDDCGNLKYDGYNHMDMKGAYKNVFECSYYKGYLGKITDFRPTNKMVGIGIYTITNIKLSDTLHAYNDIMFMYRDGISYPSVELEYLLANGCSFDITEGCWGSTIDFKMDEDIWSNKENDVKYYCKYVGSMYSALNNKDSFYMRGEPEYLSNMISIIDYDTYSWFEDSSEIKVNYDRSYNKHLSHIASFITSYTRINMLEQLSTMKVDDVLRVCVDGIYYYGNYECKNIFRDKPNDDGTPNIIKNNYASHSYISNFIKSDHKCESLNKEHNMKELHLGAGGSGKTHSQLVDKGFIRPLFLAPSWKLAINKRKELDCYSKVWYSILSDDPEEYNKVLRNYNVLIIDEVSMLCDTNKKKILERFKDCKIIMCGDVGYQLDGFSIDKKNPFIPLKFTGFDKVITHNENYRVKDKNLLNRLNHIRKLLSSGNKNDDKIYQYVNDNFNHIKEEDMEYVVEDMILASQHIIKDTYLEKYNHLDKWYIKTTNKNYSKGDITIGDKPDVDCVKQHAFTIHSIQGETASNKLFIDLKNMRGGKMIYTALSRAKYLDQIYLI
tara:strand:- start:365 stop:3160 length:2796 start_codon:yes stop_codon:yes gene_type:complete